MVSKRKAGLIAFAVAATALSSALFLYTAPASTSVNPAPFEPRAGIAGDAAIEPWSNFLSDQAVDSNGIEKDLDGNASMFLPL
jgi:hypothetical protein